jgi:ribosomal subunit interface protein
MDVRITARRATVGEAFLKHAEDRVRKLDRYEPRLQAVTILVDEDRGRVSVEVRADVPGAAAMIASSTASSDRSALDGALEKLRRRLRRSRSRRTDRKAPPGGSLVKEA